LEYLLQATDRARQQVAAHLLIAGEFWDNKERYLRLIEQLGLVPHVTVVDKYVPNEDLGMYLAAADAVVLPYVETSQSAAARLALDAGVPVIASAVGGLREMIADGVNGLLVEPRDVQSLGDAIVRYFREDLGLAFRRELSQPRRDGWDEVTSTLERLVDAGI
jgi:glycosyltransferase involved in cell wall biosynthesis